MSDEQFSASTLKVQQALDAMGLDLKVMNMPESTRTAQEAAEAVGCQIGQIVKSLVFKTRYSQKPVLVVASGPNRVNEKKVGELLGEPLVKADAEFVRETTGFAIGGVPPLGHLQPIKTFVDKDLLQFESIWAAAGTPRSVFCLTPADLVKITGGKVIDIG